MTVVGIGARPGVSAAEVLAAVDVVLPAGAEGVRLATLDARAAEPGLVGAAAARGWPVLTFTRPVSLRDRIPAPSGAAVATTAAVGMSALAAGALTYSLLRRFAP